MNESNLHSYQAVAADHIINTPKCGLFMDMGLGKTVSTLTAINRLIYDYIDVGSVLVVSTKRIVEMVWDDECMKWDHLKHLQVSKIIGSPKKREEALGVKADLYLVSRDNVKWLCDLYGGVLPFDMLVIDESSSFKNHRSQRFKALRKVPFDRVVLLTGTPAPNGLIDLWSQIYLLDKGERLGRTIGAYRERYFTPGHSNGHIVYNYRLRKGSDEKIRNEISDICISMKATDYLDMPDFIDNVVKVKLSDATLKKYKEFQKEQVLGLIGQDITATNAAALSNKLLQFANGAVYDEDRSVHEIHSAKLEALEELVECTDTLLVAWTYQHDRDRILKHLKKYKPVQFKGDQDMKDWNAGKIKVMLLHPASGGHGLNLQAGGHNIVWFGQTWSLELYKQFNARLYRQGQQYGSVTVNRLVAVGTLDEKVVLDTGDKDQLQERLLESIKAIIDDTSN